MGNCHPCLLLGGDGDHNMTKRPSVVVERLPDNVRNLLMFPSLLRLASLPEEADFLGSILRLANYINRLLAVSHQATETTEVLVHYSHVHSRLFSTARLTADLSAQSGHDDVLCDVQCWVKQTWQYQLQVMMLNNILDDTTHVQEYPIFYLIRIQPIPIPPPSPFLVSRPGHQAEAAAALPEVRIDVSPPSFAPVPIPPTALPNGIV